MTDPTPHPATAPAPGPVAHDLPCAGCRYNLRGLEIDGPCAECGGRVLASFAPDRLVFADARWLARTRLGFIVLCAAPPAGIILLATCAALIAIVIPPWRQAQLADVLIPGLACLTLYATAVGVWIATTPDRRVRGAGVWRWSARLASLVPPLLATVLLLEPARRFFDRLADRVPPEFIIPPLLFLSAGAVMAGLAGVISWLSRRARPAPGVRRWAFTNACVAGLLLAFAGLLGAVLLLDRAGVRVVADHVLGKSLAALLLSWLIAGLSTEGLNIAALKLLRLEARSALDPALARPRGSAEASVQSPG